MKMAQKASSLMRATWPRSRSSVSLPAACAWHDDDQANLRMHLNSEACCCRQAGFSKAGHSWVVLYRLGN